MTVGNNIKKARGNIKQAELAEILSVDVSTISRWENDKNPPNSKMLQKIADALNVTTAFLLDENNAIIQESANKLQDKNKILQYSSLSALQNGEMLFLKDGDYEVSVPDTEENRHEFWNIVKQIFNKTPQVGLSIKNGEKNQYSVGDITLKNCSKQNS